MTSPRFELRKDGKDWLVFDTENGDEVVRRFNSRRGLPASSLESRALNLCHRWNEVDAANPGVAVIYGEIRPGVQT